MVLPVNHTDETVFSLQVHFYPNLTSFCMKGFPRGLVFGNGLLNKAANLMGVVISKDNRCPVFAAENELI